MMLLVDMLCLISLSAVVYQDFSKRTVSGRNLLFLCSLFFIKSFLEMNIHSIVTDFFICLLFLLSNLILVALYFSIRHKRIFNIIDSYLGSGDILFFLSLALVFSPISFIVFFSTSLMLTLFAFGIWILISRQPAYKIPLAGCQAFFLVILFSLQIAHVSVAFRCYDPTLLVSHY